MKVYGYDKCDTCRKARKFLDARGVKYEAVDITQTPPTRSELKKMLKAQGGNLKKLFNTSGQVYRERRISDKLPHMTEAEALELLSQTGKLVKRPFVLSGENGLVGFREEEWKKVFR